MTKKQKDINWAEEEESVYRPGVKISPIKNEWQGWEKITGRPCIETKEVNVILPISG